MGLLLRPGINLMRRCQLYQKFSLVSIFFILPAGLITILLIRELHRSIDMVHQERLGIQVLSTMQSLESLVQTHRGWQHLARSGNVKANEELQHVAALIEEKSQSLENQVGSQLSATAKEAVQKLNTTLSTLKKDSLNLKPVEAYQLDSALLDQLRQLRTIVSDSTQLSLDPQVETTYLIQLLSKNLPELLATIADTSARGAPYIDTGLMGANDDVIINANILLGQRDQAKLLSMMQTAVQSDSKLVPIQQALEQRLNQQQAFTQRTKDEILSTLNQTNSTSFLKAGIDSIDQWQKWGDQIRDHLDVRLQERLRTLQWNRDLTLIIILFVLTLAAYFLLSFYYAFSQQVLALSQSAQRISQGNLSEPLKSDGKDELAVLQIEFENMRLVLARLVAEIRTGAVHISGASQEIASGNAELSSRTELQAQSLSATAFSTNELTNTLQRNSNSAVEANQQAWQTREIARKGGEMVEQLVVRMESMQGSSQRIHDIIGVIDSIAFQTNILALNAAVEAARAGEQGRGFAVVATEVRSLAQRSAEAAKEIKVLISSSVEQIRAGHVQVKATGSTMQQLLNGIDEVTDKMKSISDASAEQTKGIQVVDTSINQLDNITQQNTALVEEAAAAADNLYQQARRLTDAVAFFAIEEEESRNDEHFANSIEAQEERSGQNGNRLKNKVQTRALISISS